MWCGHIPDVLAFDTQSGPEYRTLHRPPLQNHNTTGLGMQVDDTRQNWKHVASHYWTAIRLSFDNGGRTHWR